MSAPEEAGWYPERGALVARALACPLADDLWCFLTLWRLGAEAPDDRDALIDELDRRLALALEQPTLWAVLAAWRAEALVQLPTAGEARAAARTLVRTAPPEVALQLAMAGVVEPGDPALGDLMGHMASAAGRCLASTWANTPAAHCEPSDLASGLLWLSTSGNLDDRLAAAVATEELRWWRRVEESEEPGHLAWLLLLD